MFSPSPSAIPAAEQVAALLIGHFPVLEPQLRPPGDVASLPEQFSCLATFTRHMAQAGQLDRVQQCFTVVERLLPDPALATAIEAVYLPALAFHQVVRGPELIRRLMPGRLYLAYCSL